MHILSSRFSGPWISNVKYFHNTNFYLPFNVIWILNLYMQLCTLCIFKVALLVHAVNNISSRVLVISCPCVEWYLHSKTILVDGRGVIKFSPWSSFTHSQVQINVIALCFNMQIWIKCQYNIFISIDCPYFPFHWNMLFCLTGNKAVEQDQCYYQLHFAAVAVSVPYPPFSLLWSKSQVQLPVKKYLFSMVKSNFSFPLLFWSYTWMNWVFPWYGNIKVFSHWFLSR